MRNLYNRRGKVHPSPPSTSSVSDQYISLLPATIFTLAAALSDEDKQVLAYLISCSGGAAATNINNNFRNSSSENSRNVFGDQKTTSDDIDDGKEHDPMFNCNCFNCYMSFWVRWDASRDREMIHDIIEAYEEGLFKKKKKSLKKKKKDQKGKQVVNETSIINSGKDFEDIFAKKDDDGVDDDLESKEIEKKSSENVDEKSTVRKITGFLGEKIWGIWSRD